MPLWANGEDKKEEEFVPLVDGPADALWEAGWCVYDYTLEDGPEIELICGGDNSKIPGASGIFRQGHLLHFGFEQSPSQLNATGRHLLLNSIHYIALFAEDRAQMVVASPFAGGKERFLRPSVARRALDEGRIADFEKLFVKGALPKFEKPTAADYVPWLDMNGDFIRSHADGTFSLDDDARTLAAPLDRSDFLTRVIEALADPRFSGVALRLVERSIEGGPAKGADAAAWKTWLDANRTYLYFSVYGRFHWHLDPLAQARGVPSRHLRGADRATPQPTSRPAK